MHIVLFCLDQKKKDQKKAFTFYLLYLPVSSDFVRRYIVNRKHTNNSLCDTTKYFQISIPGYHQVMQ